MPSLPNNSQIIEPSFGRVEVLKGPGIHRRWSDGEKARTFLQNYGACPLYLLSESVH